MKSVVHYSQEGDSFLAGSVAVEDVYEQLGTQPDLLLLFSSIAHDLPKVIQGIEANAVDVPLCGCTGAGIITGAGSDEATHSMALMGIAADNLIVTPFMFPDLSVEPEAAGVKIASRINEAISVRYASRLLLLFADGLTINADRLSCGMSKTLSAHIDIVGGTAGNDYESNKTYQFCNGEVKNDAVCGVLIQGDFRYCIGVTHGSRPVGLFRTITKAYGNLIYEIDNIPALDLLKQFIGPNRLQDAGQLLNLFELGEEFPGNGYSENILNRAIIGVDENSGAIRLAVEIREGTKMRITSRDANLVLRRTREMAEKMSQGIHDLDSATFLYFNCSGRGTYLFGDPEQDVNVLRNVLAPSSSLIGFFTFGEFAPINDRNYFHNYTGVLVGMEE